jgi:hypothetical protein
MAQTRARTAVRIPIAILLGRLTRRVPPES